MIGAVVLSVRYPTISPRRFGILFNFTVSFENDMQMRRFTFPKALSESNTDNVINILLQNAARMSVVFPRHNADIIVFDNLILCNLYLQIGSIGYPAVQ
jgi:hypothetical protein